MEPIDPLRPQKRNASTKGYGRNGPHFSTPARDDNVVSRLQVSRGNFSSSMDGMEVFSPLVDVQPITPSVAKYWDPANSRREYGDTSNKVAPRSQKLTSVEDNNDRRTVPHPQQDFPSTPPTAVLLKGDRSPSVTPPEAWGGDIVADRDATRLSRFASGTTSASAALSGNVRTEELPAVDLPGTNFWPSGSPIRTPTGSLNRIRQDITSLEMGTPGVPARQITSSADRSQSWGSTTLGDLFGESPRNRTPTVDSPRNRDSPRTGDTPRNRAAADERSELPITNGGHDYKYSPQPQQSTSFGLQLIQRTLEESVGAVQKSIHDDVHNLHLDLLRQFHIQQSEMASMVDNLVAKQKELMDEIQALRKENQQLRQFF